MSLKCVRWLFLCLLVIVFFTRQSLNLAQAVLTQFMSYLAEKHLGTPSRPGSCDQELTLEQYCQYNNRVYVRGHKYVLGPTQTHFNSKMSLRRAQNIFMPKNINSITINITLEGTEKIKTEKKWQQNSLKNIFFTSALRKRQQTLKWLLDFEWLLRSYDYLILIFYWFISAG